MRFHILAQTPACVKSYTGFAQNAEGAAAASSEASHAASRGLELSFARGLCPDQAGFGLLISIR
jgi:hypothetical protein